MMRMPFLLSIWELNVIPFTDSPDIGQPSQLFLRNIIATVFDVTIIAWGQVLTSGEIDSSSSEPDIAGRLARTCGGERAT